MTKRIRRRAKFRGLEWFCVAGHRTVLVTSFYRLHAARAACIGGNLLRHGVRCSVCGECARLWTQSVSVESEKP